MSKSRITESDLQALTIGHGRKLYSQSEEIKAQLNQLMPLLGLLEAPTGEEGADPILTIVKFLETLQAQCQQMTEALQKIDAKLTRLLANDNIAR